MCWKMFLQCMKIANHLASAFIPNQSLQFRFSKKAKTIWENLSMDLNQLGDFVRFSKKAVKVMAKSFTYWNSHQLSISSSFCGVHKKPELYEQPSGPAFFRDPCLIVLYYIHSNKKYPCCLFGICKAITVLKLLCLFCKSCKVKRDRFLVWFDKCLLKFKSHWIFNNCIVQ